MSSEFQVVLLILQWTCSNRSWFDVFWYIVVAPLLINDLLFSGHMFAVSNRRSSNFSSGHSLWPTLCTSPNCRRQVLVVEWFIHAAFYLCHSRLKCCASRANLKTTVIYRIFFCALKWSAFFGIASVTLSFGHTNPQDKRMKNVELGFLFRQNTFHELRQKWLHCIEVC